MLALLKSYIWKSWQKQEPRAWGNLPLELRNTVSLLLKFAQNRHRCVSWSTTVSTEGPSSWPWPPALHPLLCPSRRCLWLLLSFPLLLSSHLSAFFWLSSCFLLSPQHDAFLLIEALSQVNYEKPMILSSFNTQINSPLFMNERCETQGAEGRG